MALARMIVVRRKACDFHLPFWRRWLAAALAAVAAAVWAYGAYEEYLAEVGDRDGLFRSWAE